MTPENKAIVAIVAVLAAVAVAVGGWWVMQDEEPSSSNSQGNSTLHPLTYTMDVREYGGGWEVHIAFYTSQPGSYRLYLDDSPILDGVGRPIMERWSSPYSENVTYGTFYDCSYEYAKNHVRVLFSSNFDPVLEL